MSRGNPTLKKLDRWIGIPAVMLASVMPNRPRPSHVTRIGFFKSAAIGDMLLLGGLVDDVRAAHPDATLVAITGPDNAAAAALAGPFDETIIVRPASPLAAARSVREAHLDVLFDFGAWPRFDALLAKASGAYTVGFRTPGQRRHFAYDLVVDHSDAIHERENYARLLTAFGVVPHSAPAIHVPGDGGDALPFSSPYVVFHAWSTGYLHETREWTTEAWVELARRLSPVYSIVLSGSRADAPRSRTLAQAMERAGAKVRDASGMFTIAQLPRLFVRSVGVVSVNTGVMHLASLAGARTVGLHGPTSAMRWGPLGPRARVVESALPGCGFLNLGFEYAGHRLDCMRGISVDAVYEALTELMSAS